MTARSLSSNQTSDTLMQDRSSPSRQNLLAMHQWHVCLAPKADQQRTLPHVSDVPRTGLMQCSKKVSFDDLVGAREQRRRNFEAERLGGFQIDDQFKGHWLLYWQIGWVLATENAAGVNTDLAIYVRNADTVAHQAACHSEFAKM